LGRSEEFSAMAKKSPEEAAAYLRSVTMGDTPGEWNLAETDVEQLWSVVYEGLTVLCGANKEPHSSVFSDVEWKERQDDPRCSR
jgi:hypothetical protein